MNALRLLLALAALLAAAPSANAQSFGFKDEPPAWQDHAGRAAQAGAKFGGLSVSHGIIDRFGWGRVDEAHRAMRQQGIKPVLTLAGGRTQTMSDHEWRGLVRDFAARYPASVLQILNETNIPEHGGQMSARSYAHRLKIAYRAIRSVRPKARVLAAAPGPVGNEVGYTRAVFRHIPRRMNIHASAHLYPREPNANPIKIARRDLQRIVRAAKRPVWVTETALMATAYGAGRKRARRTGRLVRTLQRQPQVRAVIYYRLQRPTQEMPFDYHHKTGALDERGNPTPVFRALSR